MNLEHRFKAIKDPSPTQSFRAKPRITKLAQNVEMVGDDYVEEINEDTPPPIVNEGEVLNLGTCNMDDADESSSGRCSPARPGAEPPTDVLGNNNS